MDRGPTYRQDLSRDLSWLLRYGATREGLAIHDGGFVKMELLLDVMHSRRKKTHKRPFQLTRETLRWQVLEVVQHSFHHDGCPRFEMQAELIRASRKRKIAASSCDSAAAVASSTFATSTASSASGAATASSTPATVSVKGYANFAFDGSEYGSDYLTFENNAVLELIQYKPDKDTEFTDGWAWGKTGDRKGWFPMVFWRGVKFDISGFESVK